MKNKDLYVGISFHLDEGSVSDIFANGALQNIFFLYFLLKKIPFIKKVSIVYLGNKSEPHGGLMLDELGIEFENLNDVAGQLDLLIEGTVIIEPEHAKAVHDRGGKVVSYRIGNDFVLEMQSFLFDQKGGRFFNGAEFDAVWTIPQHENTCKSYFSIMLRCPITILPHIWSPIFLDKSIEQLKGNQITFGYQPRVGKKRVSNFEANRDIVKTCYIPVLICEKLYRENKDCIEHVYLCNTYDKKDRLAFFNFIGRTDLVRDNVMTVEGRYKISDFLSRYTDIVVAHQWENALNYAYYEALYGGYPLVHNSPMLPVGYYYSEFDAEQGATILSDVIASHDLNHAAYVKSAKDFLETLSVDHPSNIEAYAKAIQELM
ncbi:DUF2827 family protein [Acinetobacter sp. MB5]|uniref:DUF2827 family protein n=1 Tax=Acinetobacter sp. MB5 TaxID=2069438 RepID=UPI000DD08680|nr:DUF2827 family protein [Acinetobacter sp. MB5]